MGPSTWQSALLVVGGLLIAVARLWAIFGPPSEQQAEVTLVGPGGDEPRALCLEPGARIVAWHFVGPGDDPEFGHFEVPEGAVVNRLGRNRHGQEILDITWEDKR